MHGDMGARDAEEEQLCISYHRIDTEVEVEVEMEV